MPDYDSLLAAAFRLPLSDRERLVDELASSLDDSGDFTLSPEWQAEVDRRAAEYESGNVEALDWEVVREKVARQVGLDGHD